MLRQGIINKKDLQINKVSTLRKLFRLIKKVKLPQNIKESFFKLFFNEEYKQMEIGKFRLSGEIHQWMYDIYSLGNLLKDVGFKNIEKMDFNKSKIADWHSFTLDEVNNKIRKPDSLFVEGIK
jgi:hypothetical protein